MKNTLPIIGFMLAVSTDLSAFTFNSAFWHQPTCTGTILCGDSSANNCYTGTNSASAITAGYAKTPTNKCLVLSTGSGSFKVWTEEAGDRILKATGLDDWQRDLVQSGKGWGSTWSSSAGILSLLKGRACPDSVYIDDTNKVASGQCVYYTVAFATQSLNADGSDGISGLIDWPTMTTTASWYTGNIQTCWTKGMRLPTVYEADCGAPVSGQPTDATPTFNATNGIPFGGGGSYNWTATAYNNGSYPTYYIGWKNSSINGYPYTDTDKQVTCVMP